MKDTLIALTRNSWYRAAKDANSTPEVLARSEDRLEIGMAVPAPVLAAAVAKVIRFVIVSPALNVRRFVRARRFTFLELRLIILVVKERLLCVGYTVEFLGLS